MLNTTIIYSILWYRSDIRSAFHSKKTSENFGTGTNGADIFWERTQKIRKLLNFRKAIYSKENIGYSEREAKWNGIYLEKFQYTSQGCPLFRKFQNCCSFRRWKFPKNSNPNFSPNGKRPSRLHVLWCFPAIMQPDNILLSFPAIWRNPSCSYFSPFQWRAAKMCNNYMVYR